MKEACSISLAGGAGERRPIAFVVLRDLPVKVSRGLPWFDAPGGEVQYRTAYPAEKMPTMIKELK